MITYVETRDVPVDRLTPYPGNAKRGDVAVIQESLQKHGQYRALVVQDLGDTLIILAGNHTHAALVAEGYATARCELIYCTPDEAARINLIDNRAAELGTYDDTALIALLEGLGGNYDGTGYTQDDLERLTAAYADEELPPPGDAPTGDLDGVWGVIVTCDTEQQQARLLEQLSAEGFNVRAMVTSQ